MSKTTIDSRRQRRIVIDPAVLLGLLQMLHDPARRDRVTASGLPADVTLIDSYSDPLRGLIYLYVASGTFEALDPGAVPPTLAITFTKECSGDE